MCRITRCPVRPGCVVSIKDCAIFSSKAKHPSWPICPYFRCQLYMSFTPLRARSYGADLLSDLSPPGEAHNLRPGARELLGFWAMMPNRNITPASIIPRKSCVKSGVWTYKKLFLHMRVVYIYICVHIRRQAEGRAQRPEATPHPLKSPGLG